VLGTPAIFTVLLWAVIGERLEAHFGSDGIQAFGGKISLQAVGPAAIYFGALVAAYFLNPIDEDDLMPVRKQLAGNYKIKFKLGGEAVSEGDLHVRIDNKVKRLTMDGTTSTQAAITIARRIMLSEDCLAFVAETDCNFGSGIQRAKIFVECFLTADRKNKFPKNSDWSRIDGDGQGSVEIQRV
jgi:hypothetical protein